MGRSIQFGEDIAAIVLERIAAGESLRKIARDEAMPEPSTVCGWVLDRPSFGEQYTRARQLQAQILADELFEIADDGSNDTYEIPQGEGQEPKTGTDHDVIARSRLRVDTRKWYLSKVLPKIYGDRLAVDHSVDESLANRLNTARIRAKS